MDSKVIDFMQMQITFVELLSTTKTNNPKPLIPLLELRLKN